MATIERVEVLMVTPEPQVVRTDAIQSFVSQQTPIVRVYDSDVGLASHGISMKLNTVVSMHTQLL